MRSHDAIKQTGSHYTPPELAEFLARLALQAAGPTGARSVLDPACGDGSLLTAVAAAAGKHRLGSMRLAGFDRNPAATRQSRLRLAAKAGLDFEVETLDFLERAADATPHCDLIIANPPYVRTQVLGAAESRRLAAELQLSGRVDLHHAFVRAMTAALPPGGILALLCPNRFLSTLAGASVRRILARDYELLQVIDLGDTKLFGAAVLPAIVIAKRTLEPRNQRPAFTRVYELRDAAAPRAQRHASVLSALSKHAAGPIRVGASTFSIESGGVVLEEGGKPWLLASPDATEWLERIRRHAVASFDDVARIRVGIKTTADAVFVRSDWQELEPEQRPEAELLHPLLTHHVAGRWLASAPTARVLYPHETVNGRRRPIELEQYPRAQRYLLRHRERLEARRYVTLAGRRWYEIWVPQHPDDWKQPKLVCPDISEAPRFSLDGSGAIVQGDCYWLTLKPGQDARWLLLMLAVANSPLAVKFYDTVCGNRLYAGRRRFITQYLKRFPLPALDAPESAEIIDVVSQLLTKPHTDATKARLEAECNRLVERSFGLDVADQRSSSGFAER